MTTNQILHKYQPQRDLLLNILHEIQANNPQQYITNDDIKAVAKFFNTTLADIMGVISYYSMFSLYPRAKYIIRCCKSPVCAAQGSMQIYKTLSTYLQLNTGSASKDGLFYLEEAECLGHCHEAPALMINDTVYTNLNEQKIIDIIEKYKNTP